MNEMCGVILVCCIHMGSVITLRPLFYANLTPLQTSDASETRPYFQLSAGAHPVDSATEHPDATDHPEPEQ